jgi:hypothetical protein
LGLGNVDNTADTNKPVSTAQQTALNLKSPIDSPAFTTSVTLPSWTTAGRPSPATVGMIGWNTTLGRFDHCVVAGSPGTWKNFVRVDGDTMTGALILSADPVTALGAATKQTVDLKAPLASPALTGVPTAPTAAAGTNTNQLATTAFVQNYLPLIQYFGDGSDGTVTISSGTTTLTRDMFYANLTLSGTGVLNTGGFRVFVNGILDISAAQSGAIINNGSNGSVGAAAGTAGVSGVSGAGGFALSVNQTNNGGAGGLTTGTAASASGNGAGVIGGGATAAGTGGTGTAGNTGGAGTAAITPTTFNAYRRFTPDFLKNGTSVVIGSRASGGGGGGGDGTVSGGGGGGGGGAGGFIWISANIIARGTNVNTAVIQSKGGTGAAGGSPASGNASGGGGGSGGSGGFVYIAYGSLTGSTITNCIDVSGGAGGAGGNGRGTALLAAVGGGSGGSGRVTMINLLLDTSTETAPITGTAGSAGSGLTGGAGAAANTSQVNL